MKDASVDERSVHESIAPHLCGLIVFVFCLNTWAFADCNVYGGGNPGTATISLPATLSIPRDSAAGRILFDSNWVATNVVRPNCSAPAGLLTWGYATSLVPIAGFPNVYSTGVTGIGVKASWANTVVNVNSYTIDQQHPLTSPVTTDSSLSAGLYGNMGYFRVQLIETGPVLAGTFNLPAMLANANYGSAVINVLQLANNAASVAAPVCTVQQSAVAVTMPTGTGRNLPSVGSTTGDTGFSISLNCPSPVSVSMTLTDVTDPTNVTNTLSLSSDSTAKGIGYQLVYQGNPVSYGPDSAVMKNANQFMVGTAVSGALTIPFVARYVRTGTITPGSANAKATFTMSYQ